MFPEIGTHILESGALPPSGSAAAQRVPGDTSHGSRFAGHEPVHRVLIVDDEEAIAFAAKRYLDARHFEVDVALNESQAETLLRAGRYDALVADLRLGHEGNEGFRVIERARSLVPTIGVVLVTAYGSPAVEIRAKELSVDRLIRKPATLAKLAEALNEVVGDAVRRQTEA
jgi:DNA-binding response OmpR family regulator